MRRVYKNLCPATISASIMAVNMWKNSLKNVESVKNKILYEILIDFFLQRNVTYCLNMPRIILASKGFTTDVYFVLHIRSIRTNLSDGNIIVLVIKMT